MGTNQRTRARAVTQVNPRNPEQYVLRPATQLDADLLLRWRNDSASRQASHNTAEISRDEHMSWLAKSLADPNRRVLVAEAGDAPVGSVRAERSDGAWKLSWTVAPEQRGRGIGKAIVAAAAKLLPGRITAEVKHDNVASARIALHVGMHLARQAGGVLYFERPAPPSEE
jgi:RimJ/RimL family protein N-acetyltransferase